MSVIAIKAMILLSLLTLMKLPSLKVALKALPFYGNVYSLVECHLAAQLKQDHLTNCA